MKVTFLPSADLEATEAALWYDQRRLGLGDEFLIELQDALHRIAESPLSHPRSEAYSGAHEVRRCLLKRFPYLVIYLCRSQQIVVVAVSHVRRHPLYWLERLP